MNTQAFTHIPRRSFEAFVGDREATIDAVLAALAVDPLEAEDAYKLFGVKGIPHSLKDFADRGRVAYRLALETIAQWVASRADASKSIEAIAKYDPRLAVWCACEIARRALLFLPSDGPWPITFLSGAIESAEGWVMGLDGPHVAERSAGYVRSAIDNNAGSIFGAVASAAYGAAYAVRSAAEALDESVSAYDAAFHRDSTGFRTSYAAASSVDAAGERASMDAADEGGRKREAAAARAMAAERVRLCEVVANACLSYPVLPT